MDDIRCGLRRRYHGAARIESDIGVILMRSVAIFVQPKLSRNMSTCPDRGIAGQVDMLFATFKSGRGTKRSASAPFMDNGSRSATMRSSRDGRHGPDQNKVAKISRAAVDNF
jgi:hypothetical protein